MLKLIKQPAPTWWQLPGETEPRAEVLLAPLSSLGMIDARNNLYQTASGGLSITGAGALAVAQECVREWRNVCAENGEPLNFSRKLLQDLEGHAIVAIASEAISRKHAHDQQFPTLKPEVTTSGD
jgi:hypothetical protein